MSLPPFRRGEGPVPGEGSPYTDIVVIGESPGYNEAWKGRPFIGKTGDEIDHFFDGIRLPLRCRSNPEASGAWFTNLYKLYKPEKVPYTQTDLQENGPWLIEELQRLQPTLVITLGRESTRWCLGDVDLEGVHSIAWDAPEGYFQKVGVRQPTTIFPIVHPAAGMHNPEMSAYVTYGFTQLAAFLAEEFDPRRLFDDQYEGKEVYEEITTTAFLQQSLRGLSTGDCCAVDTEGTPGKPWSLQFSVQPGTAGLIRATRGDLLTAFHRYLVDMGVRITFHSALHDLGMMRAVGIPWLGEFDDTMVMAYLLQVEPQGLKPLCLRHCGMRMQSFEDVIGGAGTRLTEDYLWSLFDIEELEYERRRQEAYNLKLSEGRRIKVLPKLPRSSLHKAVERCLKSKECRKLWTTQVDDEQHSGRTHLGPMWEATLNNVDPETAIRYGCRDADGTLRLAQQLRPRLEAMGLA